jgi:hypothetical protein
MTCLDNRKKWRESKTTGCLWIMISGTTSARKRKRKKRRTRYSRKRVHETYLINRDHHKIRDPTRRELHTDKRKKRKRIRLS